MRKILILLVCALTLSACGDDGGDDGPRGWDRSIEDYDVSVLDDATPAFPEWPVGIVVRAVYDPDDSYNEHNTAYYVDVGQGPGLRIVQSNGGDCSYNGDEFEDLAEPGDIVSWSPDGEDLSVCTDQFAVVGHISALHGAA